jgi:endo-1,4-beta-xylanase
MRTRMWRIVLALGAIALATACGGSKEPAPTPTPLPEAKTLREQADRTGFLIGTTITGVGQNFFSPEALYNSVMAQEFNYVNIFPGMPGVAAERGKFNFTNQDKQVAFAKERGLKILIHPLVWENWEKHTDTPAWLKFNQPDCGGWSPAELDQILKEWVQTYVSHYKGSVTAYVIVNEAFKRSQPPGATRPPDQNDLRPGPYTPDDLRDSCWKRILGEDFIAKAFKYAHEADPDALLIINDQFGPYGTDRVQQDKLLELVRKLKAQGVPIQAVGTQMHLGGQVGPDSVRAVVPQPGFLADFRDFLTKARDIGIQVHVTEMDVYLPPGPDLPQKLKEIYKGVLSTCLQFPNCTAFITFGITDKYSFPGVVHPDAAPLLFDVNYQPKPAYYGVMEALKRE